MSETQMARIFSNFQIPEPIRAGREYFLVWRNVRVKCPGPTVNDDDIFWRAACRKFIVNVFWVVLNLRPGESVIGIIEDMTPALYTRFWGRWNR